MDDKSSFGFFPKTLRDDKEEKGIDEISVMSFVRVAAGNDNGAKASTLTNGAKTTETNARKTARVEECTIGVSILSL